MCTGIERYAPLATEHPPRCSVAVQVATSCASPFQVQTAGWYLSPQRRGGGPAQVACVILSLTAKLSLLLVGSALVVVGAIANVIGPALMAAGRATFEAAGGVGGDC